MASFSSSVGERKLMTHFVVNIAGLLGCGSIVGLAVALIPALFNPGIYSLYITLYTVSGLTTPLDWAAPTLEMR